MKPWVWLVFFIIAISISVYLVKSNPSDKPVNPTEPQAPVSDGSVPREGNPLIPVPQKGNNLPGQRENTPNSYAPPNPGMPSQPDMAPVPNQMPNTDFANPPGFYPDPQEPGMDNPGYIPPPPAFPNPEGQPYYEDGEMVPPPIDPPPPIEGQNEADF